MLVALLTAFAAPATPADAPDAEPLKTAPVILGSLERAEIDKAIKTGMKKVRRCYAKGLASTPDLAGAMKVNFTIDRMGAVSTAKVETTSLEDEAVEGCVVDVVKSIGFPKPDKNGTVVVTYPFLFSPS